MTSYHYHVYFVDANKVSESFRFDTKVQATRKMASLKKDCQLQGEEWDGQIRWGCLESKEYNNRYDKIHKSQYFNNKSYHVISWLEKSIINLDRAT